MKTLYTKYDISRLIMSLLVAFAIAGCSPLLTKQPESVAEKLASMEIAYGEFLDIVALHKSEGRLSATQLADLKKLSDSYQSARNAAFLALDIGDLNTAEAKYSAAIIILTELRSRVN